MKVRIAAPPFCDHSLIDDNGHIELKAKARLNDLYKLLRVPLHLRPILIAAVNYNRAKLTHRLSDGDEVSIFWPLSGG